MVYLYTYKQYLLSKFIIRFGVKHCIESFYFFMMILYYDILIFQDDRLLPQKPEFIVDPHHVDSSIE